MSWTSVAIETKAGLTDALRGTGIRRWSGRQGNLDLDRVEYACDAVKCPAPMKAARTRFSARAGARNSSAALSSSICDVAIVGAGPYGLAAAAALRDVGGLEIRVFGEPMRFWETMPTGMLLRSAWEACHIGFPRGELTLDRYQAACGAPFGKPVSLEAFVSYGHWFQRNAVPDVDRLRVMTVTQGQPGYHLVLENSETIHAARVIVAAGIGHFPWRPPAFQDLPPELVSHSSEHCDLSRFADRNVLVVGGGQSALESAALMHESGAEVEVVARAPRIIWLHGGVVQRKLGRAKPLLYAQTDVGPAGISRLVANPGLFRLLPRNTRSRLAHRAIRPAGARWLVSRLADVPISTGRNVVRAVRAGDTVDLLLDDGSARRVDHVVLGTGYRVDIARYDFLTPEIVSRVRCVAGYPVLRAGLESSVPGLHFLGAPAAWSFGPIMRFVSGSWFAAQALSDAVGKSPVALKT